MAGEELESPRAAGESGDYAAVTNRVKIRVALAQTVLVVLFSQSDQSSAPRNRSACSLEIHEGSAVDYSLNKLLVGVGAALGAIRVGPPSCSRGLHGGRRLLSLRSRAARS